MESKPTSAQWENILASLEEGLVLIDRSGRLAFLNQAAEDMLRTSRSQAVGQKVGLPFRSNPWMVELVKRTQQSGHSHSQTEGDLIREGTRSLPVTVTASPYIDSSGRIEGVVVVVHDLSRRRELEEDLMHSERLALIGTFTAGLLHEIRNPLGGIKGAAQLLKRETSDHALLGEYASVMLREVERLDRLLDQLLGFSHPPQWNMAPLNIHQVLDEVLLLQKETLSRSRITLKKELDPSLPMVWGDPSGLTQVFLNVIKNAVEAMGAGGVLRIGTKMETDLHRGKEKFLRVEVEDTGPGISPENLKWIFAPFFTTKGSGTGLGLPIAQRIISEHAGSIRVESNHNVGTTFKVTLPVERGFGNG